MLDSVKQSDVDHIRQVIARLRRSQPRNTDTMRVCDELEQLGAVGKPEAAPKGPFDRRVYMREYMRKRRKSKDSP